MTASISLIVKSLSIETPKDYDRTYDLIADSMLRLLRWPFDIHLVESIGLIQELHRHLEKIRPADSTKADIVGDVLSAYFKAIEKERGIQSAIDDSIRFTTFAIINTATKTDLGSQIKILKKPMKLYDIYLSNIGFFAEDLEKWLEKFSRNSIISIEEIMKCLQRGKKTLSEAQLKQISDFWSVNDGSKRVKTLLEALELNKDMANCGWLESMGIRDRQSKIISQAVNDYFEMKP